MSNSTKIPNRLADEKSPYLLQHAYNPVDWFPWCEEAFAKAKAEDKPVFLSIGYSACHWCHVMEKESFEDQEAAELLNREFISVKVDREERPDIDAVYMSVCQSLTGSGGWPLTIIMTPEQMPFFAATYIPKTPRYGQNGLIDILNAVTEKWKSEKSKLIHSSKEIQKHIQTMAGQSAPPDTPTKELFKSAFLAFEQSFDTKYGGFGRAPKFPSPHNLLFLLRYFHAENNEKALYMVEKTLQQMYKGGIFDHVGGGFSRYSTDEKWLVPHFEKMLYDNAGLAYAYLEAYEKTKNPIYSDTAVRILDYVCRELTDELGGFYCSQDADSDGGEGKYYVFSISEIEKVLGREFSESFCEKYDISPGGNFEGLNIPNLLKFSETLKPEDERIKGMLRQICEYRAQRMKLHKDDKILTSWSSFMTAAFCKAYRVLGRSDYLERAVNSQLFIKKYLTGIKGDLFVRWREGESAFEGMLDDYSFYSWALLELYQSTFEPSYLEEAVDICKRMTDKFFDLQNGGFYLYSKTADQLIARPKEIYDGAMPSGNSVAAFVLNKIYSLTSDVYWQEIRDKQSAFMAGNCKEYTWGHSFALLSFFDVVYPSQELIAVSEKFSKDKLYALSRKIEEMGVNVIVKTKDNEKALTDTVDMLKNYPFPSEGEAYYLCTGGSCQKPVYSLNQLNSDTIDNPAG